MLELQGKFGTAKVFTDVVDNESISQVINLLNQPYIELHRLDCANHSYDDYANCLEHQTA